MKKSNEEYVQPFCEFSYQVPFDEIALTDRLLFISSNGHGAGFTPVQSRISHHGCHARVSSRLQRKPLGVGGWFPVWGTHNWCQCERPASRVRSVVPSLGVSEQLPSSIVLFCDGGLVACPVHGGSVPSICPVMAKEAVSELITQTRPQRSSLNTLTALIRPRRSPLNPLSALLWPRKQLSNLLSALTRSLRQSMNPRLSGVGQRGYC